MTNSNTKPIMNITMCQALKNVQNECCSIILSDSIDYKILQLSVLYNHLLELCKVYYIAVRKPTYDEDICLFAEKSHAVVYRGKNNDTSIEETEIEYYTNRTGKTLPVLSSPSLQTTLDYTIYKLNIQPPEQGDFLLNMTRIRNCCVHSILNIDEGIIESCEAILEYKELLTGIYNGLIKEFDYRPMFDDIVSKTIDYTKDLIKEYKNDSFLKYLGNESYNILKQERDEIESILSGKLQRNVNTTTLPTPNISSDALMDIFNS